MKFVIGLGNPGDEYAGTRHNLGWRVMDELARLRRIKDEGPRWEGLLSVKGAVALFKPLTYMNNSGDAVARLVAGSGVALENVLVVLDELNLPLGPLRMRVGGSAGGHRGLASVIQSLGTDQFPRLRLGIGPPRPDLSGRDFVLSPFDEEELPLAEKLVARAVQAVEYWMDQGPDAAMSRYNAPVQ